MPRFMRAILLLISACLFVNSVLAEPQPRFVSGVFQGQDTIKIFGENFGEQALAPDDPAEFRSAVVLGDSSVLDRCALRQPLEILQWSPQEIHFRFSEGLLQEMEKFFVFVIDDQGLSSPAIGPWLLGMGVMPTSPHRIALEPREGFMAPAGDFPGPIGGEPPVDLGPPGAPGQPQLVTFPD